VNGPYVQVWSLLSDSSVSLPAASVPSEAFSLALTFDDWIVFVFFSQLPHITEFTFFVFFEAFR